MYKISLMSLHPLGRNYITSYKKSLHITRQGESHYFSVDISWSPVVLISIGFAMEDWFICAKTASFLKKATFRVCAYR